MKYFLLLYPIHDYVEVLINGYPPSVVKRIGRQFRTLIRERYRKQGFKIVMVFFSASADSVCPDIDRKWEGIPIHKGDMVIACGVTFDNHCKNNHYPEEGVIISFFPCPVEELVIGGFHLWDCVERMAKYAFGQGIPVTVDEDLTEFGVGLRSIPILREESVRQLREELGQKDGLGVVDLIELIRERRKNKPWLAQV